MIKTTHSAASNGGTTAQADAGDLIRIDGVAKSFGSVVALHKMDLIIRRGEFLSLLGPSGCGKTTLLRIIAGFQDPSSGDVLIDGVSMRNVPPNQRPVNTVFQNYALFPHMTVAENVSFGPRRAGRQKTEIARDVAEALEMVGMESFADRFPRSLSGGQQQRIALARAIINRPRVLLLDEPLGALDLKLRKRMQLELKHLHDKLGITFVYVTHDQEEALAMSDRIAVMDKGRIAQLGTGEEIYHAPQSEYVADFIGEANILDCKRDDKGQLRLGPDGPVVSRDVVSRDARIVVRPEAIRFGDAGGAEDCVSARVRVEEKIFLGQHWRITTRTADGHEIVVCAADHPNAATPAVGDDVTLFWPCALSRMIDT